MREDRAHDQIRPLTFQLDYLKYPDGSVLVKLGDTKVICTVMAEHRVPPFAQEQGKGWITSEYSMIPGATDTRNTRDLHRGRPDGRTAEIQRLVGRCLRSVVDLRCIPERTLWVDCDVIQADGGTRTAAINGAFTALNLALLKYLERGDIVRWPMQEWLGAVSAGIVQNHNLLDLAYGEDSRAEVDLNLAATDSGRCVEIQGTAESRPISMDRLHELMSLAQQGIHQVTRIQRDTLKPNFERISERLKPTLPETYLT